MTTSLCDDTLGGPQLDRRSSVAPMMDWTDEIDFVYRIRRLRATKRPWHLNGTPKSIPTLFGSA
jgi:hypothetical protein